MQIRLRAGEFGVRLQKSKHEEFAGIGGRVDVCPAAGEKICPGTVVGAAKISRDLGEGLWGFLFEEREEIREAGEERVCSASVLLAGEWAGRPLDSRRDAGATLLAGATAFEALVKTFLKARGVDVEAENLCREGMLGCEVFRAPDAPLPGSDGHRAIMGLRLAASKCEYLPLTVAGGEVYSFLKFGCSPLGL